MLKERIILKHWPRILVQDSNYCLSFSSVVIWTCRKENWDEQEAFPHDRVSAGLSLWDGIFRSKSGKNSECLLTSHWSEASGCMQMTEHPSALLQPRGRTGSPGPCLRSLCCTCCSLDTYTCPNWGRLLFLWGGLDYKPPFPEAAHHPTGASLFKAVLMGTRVHI